VLLLPRGHAHAVRDDPDTKAVPFDYTAPPAKAPAFRGVCGTFRFEDPHTASLFAALPKVMHVRELSDEIGPWLEQTMHLIGYEAARRRPGADTAAAGLCDTLFVYLLRSHLARLPAGWLKALSDPQVGRALELIHAEPAAPWTVPGLAAKVGMSRSKFATRFASVVGRSPLQYVIDWRLQKAASLLRDSRRTLAEIAAEVGYETEAAFNKAFRRGMGVPPGEYRTTQMNGRTMNGREGAATVRPS
jgi:AraC-like DNA-binding protein